MKTAQMMKSSLVIASMAVVLSGCFATRMVRTDTSSSYDLVRAQPMAQLATQLPTQLVAGPPPQADGTLVVEALVVPPPPSETSTPRPVRIPSEVATTSTRPAAPAWDPLPSYVSQYAHAGWVRQPLFYGSTGGQQSTSFRRWGSSARFAAPGYGSSTAPGAYGSASPHFSSSPSFSGSVSSHFSGGYPGSGY